jgi:hypothetical protein
LSVAPSVANEALTPFWEEIDTAQAGC